MGFSPSFSLCSFPCSLSLSLEFSFCLPLIEVNTEKSLQRNPDVRVKVAQLHKNLCRQGPGESVVSFKFNGGARDKPLSRAGKRLRAYRVVNGVQVPFSKPTTVVLWTTSPRRALPGFKSGFGPLAGCVICRVLSPSLPLLLYSEGTCENSCAVGCS